MMDTERTQRTGVGEVTINRMHGDSVMSIIYPFGIVAQLCVSAP